MAVLAGGLSHEREVSLRSGRRLLRRCAPSACRARVGRRRRACSNACATDRPDAVVIALHGGEGENGSIQAVLDLLGVPFVGTPGDGLPARLGQAHREGRARARRARHPGLGGAAAPTFRELGARAVLDAMVERLGLPLMLKPAQGGSALGAQVVRDAGGPSGRDGELPRLRRHGPGRAVHRRHRGRGLGRGRRAPSRARCRRSRSRRKGGVYDYTARYTPGATTFHCPARLDDAVLATLRETALAAHRLLGLRDVSRMDAVVDAAGRVQILEVNVSPGLTDTSLLPTAAAAEGTDLGVLFARLLDRAVARG